MALNINQRIYVSTRNGEREIQLCLGDITKLQKEEAVDVIIVSAFQNDYIPMRTTVIGALKFSLGLDVKKLAKSYKKEDLRKLFCCWISEYLPVELPYRQLMCFERTLAHADVDVITAMGELFRAMQPLFNNQNRSVITPLLATGCQGASQDEVLQYMVEKAVMWMQMGLPLQIFKIVIYMRPGQELKGEPKKCVELFSKLKARIEKKAFRFKEPSIERQIFFIFSPEDKEIANKITKALNKEVKNITTGAIGDVNTKPATWHHDMFMAMMASQRIVPLLSKSFLENQECLDLYNIALCCNRFTSRHIVAPVCLERLSVPSYMSMVQWINSRGREDEKLENAASILGEQLSSKGSTVRSHEDKYDIFISYSHKNLDKAKAFLKMAQDKDSKLKIFFDYDNLKTGTTWQQTLYQGIDAARCFVAFLSESYVQSVVCTEEFNLALARHHAKDKDMKVVTFALDDVDLTGPAFEGLRIINAHGDACSENISNVMDGLCQDLHNEREHPEIFAIQQDMMDLEDLAEENRKFQFSTFYTLDQHAGRVVFKDINPNPNSEDTPKRLFFSYSLRDQGYVQFVANLLKEYDPNVVINTKMSDSTLELDASDHAVIFLSMHYKRSPKQMEEFNLILSKMRAGKSQLYVVTLGALPRKPTYIHLVPCYTSLLDNIWDEMLPSGKGKGMLGEAWFSSMLQRIAECQKTYHTDLSMPEALALYKCATDLQIIISSVSEKFYNKVGYPKGVFVNVQLLQNGQRATYKKRDTIELLEPGQELEQVSTMHGDKLEEHQSENPAGGSSEQNISAQNDEYSNSATKLQMKADKGSAGKIIDRADHKEEIKADAKAAKPATSNAKHVSGNDDKEDDFALVMNNESSADNSKHGHGTPIGTSRTSASCQLL